MATVLPQRKNALGQGLANFIESGGKAYMNRADESALQKSLANLGQNASARDILDAITNTKTYSPEAKQTALKNYIGVAEFQELQRKTREQAEIDREKNRIAELKVTGGANQASLVDQYISAGYPQHEAELLSDPNVTPGIKQSIARNHEELLKRGVRSTDINPQEQAPQAQTAETDSIQTVETNPITGQEGQPINEEISQVEQEAQAIEEPEWPDLPVPPETTFAEKEKWRAGNQKFNNTELKAIEPKITGHRNALIRLDRANALNDTGKLPSGLGSVVIDPSTGDVRPLASLTGQVNKETQAFVKNINDFLIDAKNYFGARVTNFDIGAFKARLPSLLNTDDGRRLIIQQMKLMEELQLVHDKTLGDALKHYGRNANYSDIVSLVDGKISGKEQEIVNKLDDIDIASSHLDKMANNPAKFKDTVLMQNPETKKFKAIKQGEVNRYEKGGYIRW